LTGHVQRANLPLRALTRRGQVTSAKTSVPTESEAKRGLIWHGLVLFFLGLVTGFVIPSMTSPRLGMSAHVQGILNGMFLLLVGGIVWDRLASSRKIEAGAYWLLLYSAYGSWFFCLLAGVFGASHMLPIAGAGYRALPWQEQLVMVGLGTVGVGYTVACALLVYGVRKAIKLPAGRVSDA
jgi:(hydroxyamino)benzene mutase